MYPDGGLMLAFGVVQDVQQDPVAMHGKRFEQTLMGAMTRTVCKSM